MSLSQRQPYKLPQIEPPSLEGLKVRVLDPPLPDGEELTRRLYDRLRESAPRRERKAKEPLAVGDEVECDMLILVGGRLLPGGIRTSLRLELQEFLDFPGLLESFLDMTTFSAQTVELTMSAEYPLEELRGQQASVYLEVRRAFEVEPVDMEDPVSLERAGLGPDLEQAMGRLSTEVDHEQGEQMLAFATSDALALLAARVEAEVPQAAVDEELRRAWYEREGAFLEARPFPQALVEDAQRSYLSDPQARHDAEFRIKIGLALAAIVERESLAPETETMEMLIETAAAAARVTPEQAKASLKAEPFQARQAVNTALYLRAVEWVMSHVEFEVDE